MPLPDHMITEWINAQKLSNHYLNSFLKCSHSHFDLNRIPNGNLIHFYLKVNAKYISPPTQSVLCCGYGINGKFTAKEWLTIFILGKIMAVDCKIDENIAKNANENGFVAFLVAKFDPVQR